MESGLYNLPDSIVAFIDYRTEAPEARDLLMERQRLVRITADRKQLQLDKERGELLRVDRAMTIWGAVIGNLRSRFLSLPRKISPLLYGLTSIAQIEERLRNEVYDLMRELSNPDLAEKQIAKNPKVKEFMKKEKRHAKVHRR